MTITSHHLAQALRIAADEVQRLHVFLDDVDGWNGSDCDTGGNAAATLQSMAGAVARVAPAGLPDAPPLATGLEIAVDAGVREGVGHVGVLVTALLASWRQAVDGVDEIRPVELARMLSARPGDAPDCHLEVPGQVSRMFDEGAAEIPETGQTLPDLSELLSSHVTQALYGLASAVSDGEESLDAGAATIAMILTALDSAIRGSDDMLQTLAQMLADMSSADEQTPPRAATPDSDRLFVVDVLLRGTREDADAAHARLVALGTAHSMAGRADAFGVGEYRIHADTSAPLAVRPARGAVVRFQVMDARPDEQIGWDQLSDGVTHRGVRILERRTLRRVERAGVIACTRAPGLVEDLAHAGAVVLLDPEDSDVAAFASAARRSSTGVCLVAPCDDRTAAVALAAADGADVTEGLALPIADCRDDLTALEVSLACAPIFVPLPGGRAVAGQVMPILVEAARLAVERSRAVAIDHTMDASELAAEVQATLAGAGVARLLVAADDDQMFVGTLRQIMAGIDGVELSVMDGGQEGPSLLQGVS